MDGRRKKNGRAQKNKMELPPSYSQNQIPRTSIDYQYQFVLTLLAVCKAVSAYVEPTPSIPQKMNIELDMTHFNTVNLDKVKNKDAHEYYARLRHNTST
uniref:Uncharacterized protein n=1 Tax=Oryza sativa subsp. japonica TaxID=39947 RepID=Q2QZJ5_ORYSJ|nr:hypothetical protein LOC_Os11g45770 [Oryza sativa Japonica Group]